MKGLKDKKTGRFVKNISVHNKCLSCGGIFSPRFEVQKFCGRTCMGKSYRRNHERACVQCSKIFSAHSVKTRFCSHVCYGNSGVGARPGEKSHLWKGGITPVNTMIRMSQNYRVWRKAVFERDGYSCSGCGVRGVQFHAHHKRSFSEFPELRFTIDNGVTLCVPCHQETDIYLNRSKKKHHVI